ncbi:MAG: hypothetical protein N2169_06125 [bacterium]|nr:hypothetical protein [bacterium]
MSIESIRQRVGSRVPYFEDNTEKEANLIKGILGGITDAFISSVGYPSIIAYRMPKIIKGLSKVVIDSEQMSLLSKIINLSVLPIGAIAIPLLSIFISFISGIATGYMMGTVLGLSPVQIAKERIENIKEFYIDSEKRAEKLIQDAEEKINKKIEKSENDK